MFIITDLHEAFIAVMRSRHHVHIYRTTSNCDDDMIG